MEHLLLVLLAAILASDHRTHAEHWRLQQCLYTEQSVVRVVRSFIPSREDYVRAVERDLSEKVSARGSQPLSEDHLDNPLTRLVLLRRLSKEWPSLLAVLADNTEPSSLAPWLKQVKWPTEKQTEEAARMLMRAQTTYNFPTELLSNGFMFDQFLTNLTADDCFNVAKMYMKNELYDKSSEWLQQALVKIVNGDRTLSHRLVLQHLLPSVCATGDVRRLGVMYTELSKKYSQDLPTLMPPDVSIIQGHITNNGCEKLAEAINTRKDKDLFFSESRQHIEHHGRLCRGEGKLDSRLRCRYVHHQRPHLSIQPFKLEELQREPPVVRFLDVLTDLEAETLVKTVSNSMKVARVSTPRGAQTTEARISEFAWVGKGRSPVHDRVARRMSEMTGLHTQGVCAESNQVARYGLSGEIFTHWDYISIPVPYWKQRIATLMFYLNEVKRGGNTVFTTWNLSVRPIKNSAVFWFNQLRNGDVDPTSDHSGCPVLQGQKWVLNKWFRNGGNEVSTPCGLRRKSSFKGYFKL